MNENQPGGVRSGSKRLALRCSSVEEALIQRAVEHLGTNLSTWMRHVVQRVTDLGANVEQRVEMQARFHLFQARLKDFGPAKKMLNARAPDEVITAFLAALEESNVSHALRWALHEAAETALASEMSHQQRVEAYESVQKALFTAPPPAGPEVEALTEDGFPGGDHEA